MVKKLISTFLTVLICISAFCMVGISAEDTETQYTDGYYTYIVENGKATITKADDSYLEGEVTVPATLGGYPVTAIRDEAFIFCSFITEITLPEGLTSIGVSAFKWCDMLEKITIPNSVTSIEPSAFSGCMSLESVTIPTGVTAIARDTFYDCESLSTVKFHEGITTIGGGAFRGCSDLSTISLPASVTSIGYKAFYGTGYYNKSTNWSNSKTVLYINKYLVEVKSNEISGSYTVTSGTKVIADSVFTSCSKLTSIKLPSSVISLGSAAFYNCAELTTVNILGSIPEIKADTFKSCTQLKTVSLPATLSAIGENAFSGCVKLTSISLPENVTDIGNGAFSGCSYLKTMTLPKNLTTIGSKAFFECSALTTINLHNNIVSIGENAFSGCKKLTSITIPEKITKISADMFRDCAALATISLSDNITTIGNNAFTNTAYYNDEDNWEDNVLYIGNHLIEVKKGTYKDEFDLDMSYGLVSGEYTVKAGTVTIAQSAFLDCINLTDVILPDGLENINQSAFANCTSLKTVTLPYTVTLIPASAFSLCKSLETIYYNGTRASFRKISIGSDNSAFLEASVAYTNMTDPEMYTYSVTGGKATITGIDASASGTIYIPEELFDYPVVAIGDYAFYWRKDITNIVIPDSVETIGKYAFSNCTSLTGVSLPDGIETISEGAFFGCSSLSRITIPNSVTTIKSSAFYGCTGLTGISLPENLEVLDEYAFYNCSSLKTVTVPETTHTIGNAVFAMCENLTSATLPEEVDTLGGAVFYCCRNLTSINLPENITAIGEAMFYSCESLEDIAIPENVTDIGEGAFYYCTSVAEISLPASVNKIRENAFDGCSSLATVYYGGTENEFKRISVGSNNQPLSDADKNYLFVITFKDYDGTIIDEIMLPYGAEITPPENPSREGTPKYSYVFTGWSGFSDGLTAKENIIFTAEYERVINKYTYKFISDGTVVEEATVDYGAEIPFPSVIPTKPADLEYTYSFAGWTDFSFGMTITEDCTFTASFISTLNRFRGTLSDSDEVTLTAVDTSLSGDVTIPSTLCGYPVVAIGDAALADCANIKTITIPGSVTAIGESAFSGCSALTNITIPSGVTVINDGTFSGCTSLKKITIDKNISAIGDGAFYGCTALENIYYNGSSDDFKNISVSSVDNECFNNANVVYGCFVITFKDYDGTVLKTESLTNGEVITAPTTNPTRAKDAQYTYTFIGWEGFTNGLTATENMTFSALYSETLNQYTYTFSDADGTVLKTETADYGSVITPPEVDYEDYLDLAWHGFTDGMVLTEDIEFTAVYTYNKPVIIAEKTDNKYSVTVYGIDDTAVVFASFFNGKRCVDVQTEDYTDKSVTFSCDKEFDSVKFMLWDSWSSLKPITDVIIK